MAQAAHSGGGGSPKAMNMTKTVKRTPAPAQNMTKTVRRSAAAGAVAGARAGAAAQIKKNAIARSAAAGARAGAAVGAATAARAAKPAFGGGAQAPQLKMTKTVKSRKK